ncbi:hypothetical protein A5893_12765 [Pedobacter psychrophilus]|uniref:Uncharacterized protein n=1 Tax=Pedobacter psychrophilus TaxID=1826909 RepID=A0A179DCX7_9SPHI|nr:hypothetical protein [Pedobacter psychrophilus]OAQ38906.1 hypothetical protein A5893_12765 [Pedobacter psychrophilus]
MKKFLTLTLIAISLGFAACNNNVKSEKEIDSLNQKAADSLLNAALEDTTAVDNVRTDSLLVADTLKNNK